jgi:carbamoyl-phosphate synthase small subunit
VQYHPEAAAGPHDAAYLFDRFIDLMADASAKTETDTKTATEPKTEDKK